MTAPYHTATNGQSEHYIQTIKSKLAYMNTNLSNTNVNDINFKLNQIIVHYRIMPYPATGMYLSEILFSYKIITKFQLMLPKQIQKTNPNITSEDTSGVIKTWSIGSRIATRIDSNK